MQLPVPNQTPQLFFIKRSILSTEEVRWVGGDRLQPEGIPAVLHGELMAINPLRPADRPRLDELDSHTSFGLKSLAVSATIHPTGQISCPGSLVVSRDEHTDLQSDRHGSSSLVGSQGQ